MRETSALAAKLRAELKAKGWGRKHVSVRSEHYSMGSSINVGIKVRGLPDDEIGAIAHKYEDVRRDESGDILSGGNRFVFVRRSYQ